MKIYLAREGSSRDEFNSRINKYWGKVLLFYDTPEQLAAPEVISDPDDTTDPDPWEKPYVTHTWGNARKIGEAPYYMFPELSPDNYIELETKE